MSENMVWDADWIWHPEIEKIDSGTDALHPAHPMDNFFMYARMVFETSGKIEKARIRCTCQDEYKLYLNGKYLGRGPAPCDPEWQYFDEYEVTKYLQSGKNVFGAICYHYGTSSPHSYFPPKIGRPGFLLQATIAYRDGNAVEILSGSNWRVIASPAWSHNTPRISVVNGFKEIFDAAKDIPGWLEKDYDDSAWLIPELLGKPPVKPWVNLIPRGIPFLRQETIYPVKVLCVNNNLGKIAAADNLLARNSKITAIDASAPGSFPEIVLDFGKTVVGYLRIKFQNVGSGVITFSYGENLVLRDIDRLSTVPGLKEWSPFRRAAFRYLKITFHAFSQPVKLKSITFVLTSYPLNNRGKFKCSDELLNNIWETGRYTAKLCTQEHFEDCLWRERTLWNNDMEITAMVNYYAFGEYLIVDKCFRQLAHIQCENGSIPAFGPKRNSLLIPDYCAHFVIGLYDYFFYSGKKELLYDLFPALIRLMKWFQTHLDEYGLINWPEKKAGAVGGWCFIDWADIDKREEISGLQFLYCRALECAVEIALALEEKILAEEWKLSAEKIRKLINARLWSEELLVYSDCRTKNGLSSHISQSTNTLAMYLEIAPRKKWKDIQKYMLESHDIGKIRTPFMKTFWAEVLFRSRKDIEALNIIRNYWGEMLKRGATTFWEEFDPETEVCVIPKVAVNFNYSASCSYCHGWSAGPTYLLPMMILGIKPTAPGFKEIEIKPHCADLDWAEGCVPTPTGIIEVSWAINRKDNTFTMSIDIPKDSIATVIIPFHSFEQPQVALKSKIIWTNGSPVTSSDLSADAYKKEGHLHFTLSHAGTYTIRIKEGRFFNDI